MKKIRLFYIEKMFKDFPTCIAVCVLSILLNKLQLEILSEESRERACSLRKILLFSS